MDSTKKNKYFLLIGLKKIKFVALNQKKEILINKETLIDDSSLDESFKSLENFLDKNIITIEDKLKNYVKDIYLIIDYNNFLTINMSSTVNFKNYIDQPRHTSNFLNNIKNNLIKNMDAYDLIHMIINKFIIDKKSCSSIPTGGNYNDIFLELKFIFLQDDIIQNLKSVFSKYQILIKNICCYEYVDGFNGSEKNNIFNLAYELSNGFNEKEIMFINKSSKNNGFFEKFFNFFS